MDKVISAEKAKELLNIGMSQAQDVMENPSRANELLKALEDKVREVPAIGNSLADLPMLISMVKSYVTKEYREVSAKTIAAVIGAFLYLVKKKDLLPDNIPVIGIADDVAVLALAAKIAAPELRAYAAWKNPDKAAAEEKPAAEPAAEEPVSPERGIVRVNDFLTEAKTFFLATTDGYQAKCRPLGAHFLMDGKLLFGVGDFKEVYHQLRVNPKTEIVACKPDGLWLRYTGRAVFESDPRYEAAALEAMPNLKSIYNENTGYHMMMFHLEDASAVVIRVMGEGERLL